MHGVVGRPLFLCGAAFLGLVLAVAGCGDGGAGPRDVPAEIQVVSGDSQSGTVELPLGAPLTVRVVNNDGHPVSGVLVKFAAAPGSGYVLPAEVRTGSNGRAIGTWTMPSFSGAAFAHVIVSDLEGVVFSATALAGAPASMSLVVGDSQSALTGVGLDSAIVVLVRDDIGNPVIGQPVVFVTNSGHGIAGSPATVTDSAGRARTSWALGPGVGVDSLLVTSPGLAPIIVTAEAHPPPLVDSLVLGLYHSCRLEPGGSTACWGANYKGEVGTGTSGGAYSPQQVASDPLLASISAGGSHNCGLTSGSQLYCWGTANVALGLAPTLQGFPDAFALVAAGWGFTCALDLGGLASCWGLNASGQLGNGSNTTRATPAKIHGGHRFRQLVAGDDYACGLATSGRVYCWGGWPSSGFGGSSIPIRMSGMPLLTSLAGGWKYVCGLTLASEAWCWADGAAPAPVAGGLRFAQLAAGGHSACGVTPAGAAFCWGDNGFGEFGNGTEVASVTPVPTADGLVLKELRLGQAHGCAVSTNDELYCWAHGVAAGALGNGETAYHRTPIAVATGLRFTQLATGDYTTCGVTAAREAWCWGRNETGQLGDGTLALRQAPVRVAGGHQFSQVSAGNGSSCGLTDMGEGWCWGNNVLGQLGTGTAGGVTPTPVRVAFDSALVQIAAGRLHACAVTAGGTGHCWGYNDSGQLGDSTRTDRSMPSPVAGGYRWRAIQPGAGFSCGIDSAGIGRCWGATVGRGSGGVGDALEPDSIALPVAAFVVGPSLSQWRSCAVGADQRGYCWGTDDEGELGDGAPGPGALQPVTVAGGHDFTSIGTGEGHSCGLTVAGDAYCWGLNSWAAVGDGTLTPRHVPTAVAGGLKFISLAVGSRHSCALDAAGAAYCWGDNFFGELGIDVLGWSLTPVRIQ